MGAPRARLDPTSLSTPTVLVIGGDESDQTAAIRVLGLHGMLGIPTHTPYGGLDEFPNQLIYRQTIDQMLRVGGVCVVYTHHHQRTPHLENVAHNLGLFLLAFNPDDDNLTCLTAPAVEKPLSEPSKEASHQIEEDLERAYLGVYAEWDEPSPQDPTETVDPEKAVVTFSPQKPCSDSDGTSRTEPESTGTGTGRKDSPCPSSSTADSGIS